jgi:plasmid maintenance system antidote protein VapI
MNDPMAGHPSDFEIEDQQILREEADALMKRKGWNQTKLARMLGVARQNAGRFLREEGGIRRRTANRLAIELGFRDAEGLIAEGRIMRGLRSTSGNVWALRDSGVRVAQALGFPEATIKAVVERMKAPEFAAKSAKWWVEQIVLEDMGRRTG